MSSPVAPMVALGLVSYGNNVYNKKFTGSSLIDVKPLLFAGIGALLLTGLASIPDMKTPAIAIGWLAFTGFMLGPVQSPSPVQNLLTITKGK